MTTLRVQRRVEGLRRERVAASTHYKDGIFRNDRPVSLGLKGSPWPLLGEYFSDHYDHLDYPTIVALAGTDVPFYTSLGAGAHLQAWGVPAHRIFELDWWEQAVLRGGDLVITAAPAQHFSGRGLVRNRTFWSSFAVRTPHHSAFFSGDTTRGWSGWRAPAQGR